MKWHLAAAVLQSGMSLHCVAAEYSLSMMQKHKCTSHAALVAVFLFFKNIAIDIVTCASAICDACTLGGNHEPTYTLTLLWCAGRNSFAHCSCKCSIVCCANPGGRRC